MLPSDIAVCEECLKRFKPVRPPFCLKCGRHLDEDRSAVCVLCEKKGHSYSFGASAFVYNDVMRESIAHFKFKGRQENADFYVQSMYELLESRIAEFKPQVLIPVPVHRSRRSFRGYNQAELLANGLGEKLGIPVINGFLVRSRKTGFQKTLKASERRKNLEGAFSCSTSGRDAEAMLGVRRVLLIDDIYTTGSTAQGCTEALLRSGVTEVGMVSLSIVGGC